MSFIGGITDFLTGGANGQAEDALNKALQAYQGVNTPTVQDLTLPQLQQYVQAGILTPAQAQAVLQQGNAYDNINVDPTARQASLDALTKLQSIGDAGGMDPQEQSKLAEIQSKQNQTLGSQRSSIMDQMDQRGIPSSLMGVAEQLGAAGQDAEQAHQDAMTANADASTRALQALEASGNLGGQISQQQNSEAAQKASAQNAINQWNAANATTVNLNNAQLNQQAGATNLQNAQSVGNANTQNTNARTQYNAQLPQQVFNDQMAKAAGEAGVNEAQSKQYTGVGEQNAGTSATLINALSPGIGAASGSSGGGSGLPKGADVSSQSYMQNAAANAPMAAAAMSHGGKVPGIPHMPGDSSSNDTVPAMLSPGEIVVPRSASNTPQTALAFIKHLHRQTAKSPAHPDDVKSVLHALGSMRQGG